MTDPLDTAALRALLAEATPGPFVVRGVSWGVSLPAVRRNVVVPDHTEHSFTSVGFSHDEDAALFVAAVNALPALLDIADAARDLADYPGSVQSLRALRTALDALGDSRLLWRQGLRFVHGFDSSPAPALDAERRYVENYVAGRDEALRSALVARIGDAVGRNAAVDIVDAAWRAALAAQPREGEEP